MGHNHNCCNKQRVKRGFWSQEEDELLRNYIDKNGSGSWSQVPERAGLQRCGKSCRMRWINYLRPDLKKGGLSFTEISRLIELNNVFGNRWSVIVKYFLGRTDNEIKNVWNTTIKNKILAHRKTGKFARKPSANPPHPPTNAPMQQIFIPNPPLPLQAFALSAPPVPITDSVMIYNENLAAMPLSPPPLIHVANNFKTVSNLPTWRNFSHNPQTKMIHTQPQILMQNSNLMFGLKNHNTNFMVNTNPQVQAYPMQAHAVPNNNYGFGYFLNTNPQLQAFHNAMTPTYLVPNDNPMVRFANPTPVLHQNISFNNSNLMSVEPVGPNLITFNEMPSSSAMQEQLIGPVNGLTNFSLVSNSGVHPNNIANSESFMRLFESSAPTTVFATSSSSTTMPPMDLEPMMSSSLPSLDVSGVAPLPCSSPFW